MAHFMDCILSDQDYNIAVNRDYRTGVNYIAYCPMFGADGKPLVTDMAGNIRAEQQFNEADFKKQL